MMSDVQEEEIIKNQGNEMSEKTVSMSRQMLLLMMTLSCRRVDRSVTMYTLVKKKKI